MRKVFYTLAAAMLLAACKKDKVSMPDFQVHTSSLTYKVGDTVKFIFTGNPDNISFFSGEPGRNYEFRKRTSAANDLRIEFGSWVQFGVIYPNLQLLVSNNYNGKATAADIQAATWTDISSRAKFSTGADNTPSGLLSLKEFARPQKDSAMVYVAFRYTDTKKTQGQNRWVIRTFSATNVSDDGVVTPLAVMATGGWQQVDFKNPAAVWSITTAQLLMFGGNATADDNEDWVISKGFNPWQIAPDAGAGLKNVSGVMNEYAYVYKKPGTYKVVFDASNVRYNGEKRLTREVTLTITP
ncbi:DUF5017 domain-containing protein [Chitinophaga lutea]|uniref:DUF5017 domain-containing protein n=1 Tax=Chitinophaga lutea TaxID=2488634 RepID=A0A3N4PBW7_9BACT|nr:DUF5017 domain-containing protein [Chitinophaga lutea]RPE05726.1 DUF5017 domain-containing protein [Chitinophaga lutea]